MCRTLCRLPLLVALILAGPIHGQTPPASDTGPRPDKGPVQLPPPTQTVAIAPAKLGVHPRLLFDAAGLEALKAKMKDPREAAVWAEVIAAADRVAKTPPPATAPEDDVFMRDLGNKLPPLAFAYVMTNDPKYLEGSLKWIHAIVAYPRWASDEDLGAGHTTWGLALAYDWLYSSLSPDDRKAIEACLLRHGRLLMHHAIEQPGGFWGSAYFQNHCWINYTGATAVAYAIYETDPQEMQGWIDHTRSIFQIAFTNFGPDGGNPEGAGYVRYGTQWLIYYAELLRCMDGENLYTSPYFQKVARFYTDMMMPDWKNVVNFGDCPAAAWGVLNDDTMRKLAAEGHDGHPLWLLQKNQEAWTKPGDPPGAYPGFKDDYASPFTFIWDDPSVTPQPPDDYPLPGIYPDIGLVVFRTNWTPDAAVVAFTCGVPGGAAIAKAWNTFPHPCDGTGHNHPDANSFLFWADHNWRIGAPGQYTHEKLTRNENVWLIDDEGQRGEGKWFSGKSYFGDIPQAHLVTVATSPQADYVVGEAAPAYEPESGLTQFRRHLLFVKGAKPYVVVYDQLAAKASHNFVSYLHAYGQFKSSAPGRFEVANEPQAISRSNASQLPVAQMSPPPPGAPALDPNAPPVAYGSIFGPGAITLTPQPLLVLAHDDHVKGASSRMASGYELTATPPAGTETWLVTVVGIDPAQAQPKLLKPAPTPSVSVGADTISWNTAGEVSLNGTAISGNLLPAGPTAGP